MKSEWCEYPETPPYRYLKSDPCRPGGIDPKRFPRKRMVCPKCGRRLIACSVYDHDGYLYGYAIPRHKADVIKPRRTSRKAARARIGRGRG